MPSRLLRRLIDDAAVFPPGLAPVEVAVADHLARRQGPFARYVGPLLVPAAAAAQACAAVLTHETESPLELALIARPGVPMGDLQDAVTQVSGCPDVHLAGVELAWQPDWEQALPWQVPVTLEVPRGERGATVIADLHLPADAPVGFKLRTQATPELPVPTADELLAVFRAAHQHQRGLKFTGGLHHAVARDVPVAPTQTEWQHGVLNLLWTAYLLGSEADEQTLLAALTEPDADVLIAELAGLSRADVTRVRALFTSFGCCGVMDPIRDLIDLGALADPTPAGDAGSTTDHP